MGGFQGGRTVPGNLPSRYLNEKINSKFPILSQRITVYWKYFASLTKCKEELEGETPPLLVLLAGHMPEILFSIEYTCAWNIVQHWVYRVHRPGLRIKFNCCEMILSLGLTSSSCSQTSPSSLHQLQRPIYTGMIKLLKNNEEDQGMIDGNETWRHTASSVIFISRHPALWSYLVVYLT